MSERTKWPKWVTQTLKEEALQIALPFYGLLVWLVAVAWVLGFAKLISLGAALYFSVITSYVIGGFATLFYFALQSHWHRNKLYNAGKEKALVRSLGARHYLSWQWFAFGLFIIPTQRNQPKRAAD